MFTRLTRPVALGMLLSLHAAAAAAADDPPPRRPNVLFILADDLGYGDLGCYGQERIQTPHIDRLATQGLRFTQCYAGSTVCAPSRSALMTGQHTGHTRVRGNALVPLEPGDVTLAEVFQAAGYRTGLVGKWGLGEPGSTGHPLRQGFDSFYGYLNQVHAHNHYPDFLWRDETREPVAGNAPSDVPGISLDCGSYATDLFTREAETFLESNRHRPWFLELALTLPHANNERGSAQGDGMEIPANHPALAAYADQDWPRPQIHHAAMITALDAAVGRVLESLERLGLDQDTIVLFTSDNGPHREGGADPAFFHSAGPLRGFKRALYEGGIRVPMIVRWPGHVPAGRVSDQVWAFWDVLPTLVDLTGAGPVPAGIDGVSVAPARAIMAQAVPHPPLYWEFHEGGFRQAVRLGDWKGVKLAPDRPLELYDLACDLGETRDVASMQPDLVHQIQAFLATARTDSAAFPISPSRPRQRSF